MMKSILRLVGISGALLFGTFFCLTFGIPGFVEDLGKDFIKGQIERKIDDKFDHSFDGMQPDSGDSALTRAAKSLYQKHQDEIGKIREQLRSKAHERMAATIAKLRDLSCECREKYARMYKAGFELRITSLEEANSKIRDFIGVKYMEVATALKRDIRIFTGSNTLIFLILLLVSFLKPRAIAHLFLPSALLLTSTLICSFFYVFEQNWLLTIIYDDYLGFAYLGYLGVVFLFLCDIVLNQARITSAIINAILNVVGSAASVSPC